MKGNPVLRRLGMITAVAALALTQQACAEEKTAAPTPAPAPASASASATTTVPPASDPILNGKRQVVIKPIESSEGIVALDERGNLGITDGDAPRALFVLTPAGDGYRIETAEADPECLAVKNNGSRSLTVVAAPCDGKADQLWSITPNGEKDGGKRPIHSIASGSAFLQITRSGLIVEELGDAPLLTTYVFVDNGKAQ